MISDKCKYQKCDGNGMIYHLKENEDIAIEICKCSLDKNLERKLKFAKIPKSFENLTINSFDTEIYQEKENKILARNIKKLAIEYVKTFKEEKDISKGLYFFSYSKGSGKTRLVASIANALIKIHKINLRFITSIDLLNEIKNTWDKKFDEDYQSEYDLVNDIKNVEVLILDDIGVESSSNWVNEVFYNILSYRELNKKITLFTSNKAIYELNIDERIVERIDKMAIEIEFPNESIRKQISKLENEKALNMFLY